MTRDSRAHSTDESSSDDAQDVDEMIDDYLEQNGHRVEDASWIEEYEKYQCPDCGALHPTREEECSVCGWQPVPPHTTTVSLD